MPPEIDAAARIVGCPRRIASLRATAHHASGPLGGHLTLVLEVAPAEDGGGLVSRIPIRDAIIQATRHFAAAPEPPSPAGRPRVRNGRGAHGRRNGAMTETAAGLSGIPETLLIPLWARAVEGAHDDPIIVDDTARAIQARVDYDFGKFEKARMSQVGVSVRTMLLDRATRKFVARFPNALIVTLGVGLDTRRARLKDVSATWIDLDLPESIALRRRLLGDAEIGQCIAQSMFDLSWMDAIEDDGRSVLVIAEGLFMYFEEAELRPLVRAMAARFGGGELLVELVAPFLVGKARHHDSLKSMEDAPEFKWTLADGRELETWHPAIRHLSEWNYFDFHKDRWSWFGILARTPPFRRWFASRLVHCRFAGNEVA